ncbi:hypothetical protein [Burkholderia pseudomultivorans]|uniref:hypothetical protein n=1 Tax=Burkholderia pseudomultivorans TaxID=1207504 RepID=UPI0012D95F0B|nr:hypothetical protein [Burkholderia pseudomultivorans]
MKTHELANHLDALAKYLRSMPDADIGAALEVLLKLSSGSQSESKRTARASSPLPDDIVERLSEMSPVEIERYLISEPISESFTTAMLSELAERLGVATSKRQSRNALINQIARYFEAGQMDFMIRSARKKDS